VSITIAALLMTLVGACGNDAPSNAETTAIGNKALTQYGGFGATADGQHCAGSELVKRLGGDGAETVASQSDLTKLDSEQRDAVVAALDKCAPIAGMVGLSGQALGITSPTDPVVVCLTKRLTGKVGSMYLGLVEPDANHVLTSAFDACVPPAVFAKALANDVATTPGATAAPVDVAALTACLTPKLQGKVGDNFRRLMRAKTAAPETLKDLLGPCLPKG
jgi:hypothetical protein